MEKTETGDVRPVDILFIVDDSSSMCQEQGELRDDFNNFIQILKDSRADFHLAVISSDMENPGANQGFGNFRTAPGDYQPSGTCAGDSLPDTSSCAGRVLPSFLKGQDYDLSVDADFTKLQEDFACMALTGTEGSQVEMGLETMRQALKKANNPASAQNGFLRADALLSIVFVTDENDCSDGSGTQGANTGVVLADANSRGDDSVCEWYRNIEDSCNQNVDDPGALLEFDGQKKTAYDWCVSGNRDAVTALAGDISPNCPADGCQNKLTARSEYYDFLVELVREKNGYKSDETDLARSDVIVATILNEDGNTHYNEPTSVDAWCGPGTQGYRYQLFAEMFPSDRFVVAPICDLGTEAPANFADSLRKIAEVIGEAINGVCLQAAPMTCAVDADCPETQTCSNAYDIPGLVSYNTCSGFAVRVEFEDANTGEITTLVEGTDYTVNLESADCFQRTGGQSPVRLSLNAAPPAGKNLIVSYPRSVGQVFE